MIKRQISYLARGQALWYSIWNIPKRNSRVMDYFCWGLSFLTKKVLYVQYLALKYLINRTLWSQWFEAASVPSTVLIKLFNILLTKIKNMFCNYSVFSMRISFHSGSGASITMCKWSNHVLPWYWALKPLWRWLLSVTKCSRSQFLLLMMGAGIFIPVSLNVESQIKENTSSV